MADEEGLDRQHADDEKFRRQHSNDGGGGAAAAQAVRFDVHDFAEDVGVHGEQSAEKHRGPAKLGNMVQPTAQHEDEKIARLVQDIERRLALESVAGKIVDRGKRCQGGEPKQSLRTYQIPENGGKDCLHKRDLER